MNWSKTQIAAFENDFRKRRFIESFLLIPRPTSLTKKFQIFSQISIKRHLAVTDLIWYYVLIRFLDSTLFLDYLNINLGLQANPWDRRATLENCT